VRVDTGPIRIAVPSFINWKIFILAHVAIPVSH
jgi:hypothetical protein